MMRVSPAGFRRRLASGLIVAPVLLLGLLLKLARDRGIMPCLLPLDAAGTSPNFIVPFVVPFVSLLRNRDVHWHQTIKASGAGAAGMLAYEVLQRWMPGRTFDPYDIVATLLGAAAGVAVARAIFFRRSA